MQNRRCAAIVKFHRLWSLTRLDAMTVTATSSGSYHRPMHSVVDSLVAIAAGTPGRECGEQERNLCRHFIDDAARHGDLPKVWHVR